MKRELDTADRKIVELLQEDARLPLKSIADKVSLTSPTVSARIDRLEKVLTFWNGKTDIFQCLHSSLSAAIGLTNIIDL